MFVGYQLTQYRWTYTHTHTQIIIRQGSFDSEILEARRCFFEKDYQAAQVDHSYELLCLCLRLSAGEQEGRQNAKMFSVAVKGSEESPQDK